MKFNRVVYAVNYFLYVICFSIMFMSNVIAQEAKGTAKNSHEVESFNRTVSIIKEDIVSKEKQLGAEDPAVAGAWYKLAAEYQKLAVLTKIKGDPEQSTILVAQAVDSYNHSLKIMEKAKGHNTKEVASIINQLAQLYQFNRSFDKAEPLYINYIDIIKSNYGADSPEMKNAFLQLSAFYGVAGIPIEAQKYKELADNIDTRESTILNKYKLELDTKTKALGPDHFETGLTLLKIATHIFHEGIKEKFNGNLDKAEILFNQAIDYYKNSLPILEKTTKINTQNILSKIAECYKFVGKPDEAMKYMRMANDAAQSKKDN